MLLLKVKSHCFPPQNEREQIMTTNVWLTQVSMNLTVRLYLSPLTEPTSSFSISALLLPQLELKRSHASSSVNAEQSGPIFVLRLFSSGVIITRVIGNDLVLDRKSVV